MKNKLIIAGLPVIAALLLTGGIAFASNGSNDGNRSFNSTNDHANVHSFNTSNSNGNSWNRNNKDNDRNSNTYSFNQFNGANRGQGYGYNGYFNYPFNSYNMPVVTNGYNSYYNTGLSPFGGVNGTLLEEVLSQGLGVQNAVLVNAYNSNQTLAGLALQNSIGQVQFESNLQGLVNGGLINANQYNTLCSQGWNMPLNNVAAIF
jgi:hypothetical protein